jgi:two-component system, cell cycle sensor histidine kinase and response regulator CckA
VAYLEKGSERASALSSKANLLLVEDNAMVRRSVEAMLRGLGYAVTAVASGNECIDAVKTAGRPFDLLITDVIMPQMSGKELIDRVRATTPNLAVLFMSGYDRTMLEIEVRPDATEQFLQKPFDGEDLSTAVVKALASSKRHASP